MLPCKPCAFDQCSPPEQFSRNMGMGTGWFWHLREMKWSTAFSELPELLIFFVFLSFSAHFHLLAPWLWNVSSASYIDPFPPASSGPFLLHGNFCRQMWNYSISKTGFYELTVIFIMYQKWSSLHNKRYAGQCFLHRSKSKARWRHWWLKPVNTFFCVSCFTSGIATL